LEKIVDALQNQMAELAAKMAELEAETLKKEK